MSRGKKAYRLEDIDDDHLDKILDALYERHPEVDRTQLEDEYKRRKVAKMKINDKLTMRTEGGNIVQMEVVSIEEAKPEYPFKDGDGYWFIESTGLIHSGWWNSDNYSISRYELGRVYKTKEEAEHAFEVQKARVRLQRKANLKPDWSDSRQYKYHILYDYSRDCLKSDWTRVHSIPGVMFFSSEEEAKQSIKEDEADWKLVLGVE